MIDLFLTKRVYGMRIISNNLYIRIIGVFGIQPGDIIAVGHQRTNSLIAQVKHPFHDILFNFLYLAYLSTSSSKALISSSVTCESGFFGGRKG